MELTSAIAIVESVKNGLLAVCGLAAAVAALLAVVRYFTNGADPSARRQLITRCGHIFGSVACIGLVISIAAPLSTSLMQNAVSKDISGDADGNSWLPRVDVDGKKVKVESGDELAKSSNLGEALKKAARQQRLASGSLVETEDGTVVSKKDTLAGESYQCPECKKSWDTASDAAACAKKDKEAAADSLTMSEKDPVVTSSGIRIWKMVNAKGKVKKYKCGNCGALYDTQSEAEQHVYSACGAGASQIY